MKALAYQTRHARGGVLPTHRHHHPYAALVIDGSYTECSLDGPLICEPGTIVVHPPFHAHGDRTWAFLPSTRAARSGDRMACRRARYGASRTDASR